MNLLNLCDVSDVVLGLKARKNGRGNPMPLGDIWKEDRSSVLRHRVIVTLVALLLSWLYLLLPPESDFPGPLSDTISYLFMA